MSKIKNAFVLILACFLLTSSITVGNSGGGGGSSSKSYARLYDGDARGSTNTNVVSYTTLESSGSDFTITHSATLGSYITISTAGVYQISVTGRYSTTGQAILMASDTLINTITAANVLSGQAGSTAQISFSSVANLAASDIVWVYYATAPNEADLGDYSNQLQIIGPL